MVGIVERRRRESPVRSVERLLAVALVLLIGTYAVGTLAEGLIAPVHDAGVLAVHLAVVVALVLPAVVIAHASVGAVLETSVTAGRDEVGVAAVALGSLVTALVVAEMSASTDTLPLMALALAGVCLLSGLVLGDR